MTARPADASPAARPGRAARASASASSAIGAPVAPVTSEKVCPVAPRPCREIARHIVDAPGPAIVAIRGATSGLVGMAPPVKMPPPRARTYSTVTPLPPMPPPPPVTASVDWSAYPPPAKLFAKTMSVRVTFGTDTPVTGPDPLAVS